MSDLRVGAASISASSLGDDDAVADGNDAVRAPSQPEVVRDVQHGLALVVQPREKLEHLSCSHAVQIAGRFIADDQLRVVRQRASDRDPLLLATRQLCGQVIDLVAQPDEIEIVACALEPLPLGPASSEVERQHRILQCRQRRQQLKELVHDTNVRAPPDR